jgi:carbamoyl-phosphate synthase large subunit
MIQCNVAVTGLNSADDPAPGIAVVRSIRESREWKGRIIGLSYNALDTGIYAKGLLDEVYILPNLFNSDGLWQRLQEISQKTRIDVLMPLLDLELLSLSVLEPSLKKIGIRLLLPHASKIKMHFKLNLAGFCQRFNIKYPKQIAITSPALIKPNIARLGTPVVVKGIVHESHLASSAEEALVYFNIIKARWGLPVLLQEYIQGEEYNTDCLTDKEGRLIGAVAIRKLAITEKGKAWSGVTVKDERLLKLSQNILGKLGWIGPAELEFVKQRSSSDYYLLEINPRFGTWIYLAANAGQNLPLASIKIAMGQKVEPFPPYMGGMMFVRQCLDSICPIDYLANLTANGELILNEEKTRS